MTWPGFSWDISKSFRTHDRQTFSQHLSQLCLYCFSELLPRYKPLNKTIFSTECVIHFQEHFSWVSPCNHSCNISVVCDSWKSVVQFTSTETLREANDILMLGLWNMPFHYITCEKLLLHVHSNGDFFYNVFCSFWAACHVLSQPQACWTVGKSLIKYQCQCQEWS